MTSKKVRHGTACLELQKCGVTLICPFSQKSFSSSVAPKKLKFRRNLRYSSDEKPSEHKNILLHHLILNEYQDVINA